MKNLLVLLLFTFSSTTSDAQIIFSEDFNSGATPAGWTNQTNAIDGGWIVDVPVLLSSAYFTIPANGFSSNFVAATNDDLCNCDKSNEYFVTPAIDLSQVSSAVLNFDAFYGDNSFNNSAEDATIEVSTDGLTWTPILDLEGNPGWTRHSADLSSMAGRDNVFIGFRYDDQGGWLFGFAIDNVTIEVPPQLEVSLDDLNEKTFGVIGDWFKVSGTVTNNGASAITSMEMSYTVSGETPVVQTFNNLNVPGFSSYEFEFAQPWIPNTDGFFTIDVELITVNGMTDDNPDNNSASYSTRIYSEITVPNKIDDFLLGPPEVIDMPSANPFLDRPTDLDFFPVLGKDELWVINQRTESEGGSTLTISDASLSSPSDYSMRVDGNAWHFMSLPTAIAFSPENYNFGTSAGVQDANHNGGSFTGPTLWSSDPAIYAQPSGGNGSHLDMLHGSPFGMGIAHEKDNAFWLYDNFNKDIVRYDFHDDHGPGNDDHSDGTVQRFKGIGISADTDIPNHLILHKETGWLYFVDNGNDRVIRLDINSGTVSFNIALINEQLASHIQTQGFVTEVVIDSGLDRPCGIEIFENRLLVGDYGNGDIRVYDLDNDTEFLGVIPTGNSGLTGIKVGPDGNIWYTNRIMNTLNYMQPGEPLSTSDLNTFELSLSPNPTSGILKIDLKENGNFNDYFVTVSDVNGREIIKSKELNSSGIIDLSSYAKGVYLVTIFNESEKNTSRIILVD